MRRGLIFVAGFVVVAGSAMAGPVAAAPPENPHGPGVCLSQLAIEPGFIGAVRLGDAFRSIAGPGTKVVIDSLRGDGGSGCGAPPGPGHL